MFPQQGLFFRRQDSAFSQKITLSQQRVFRFHTQYSVSPDRTPFPQTGFRFPRQDSVSPDRIPFSQTGLRFPKQDSVWETDSPFGGFQTLLADIGTVAKNTAVINQTTMQIITTPTPLQ